MMRFYSGLSALLLSVCIFHLPLKATADTTAAMHLFAGNSTTLGKQLWQTNNSAAGTKIFRYLSTIPNADSNSYPLGVAGNYGLFAAFTPETGQELWRTDGTNQGTYLLQDLIAGPASGLTKTHELYQQTSINLNNKLLFWSSTAEHLRLYSSDGTLENTNQLANFPRSTEPALNVSLPTFYALNEQAFFWVNDEVHGLELWKTNGSAAGTRLAVDASEEPTGLNPLMVFTPEPINNSSSLFFISPDQRQSSPEAKLNYSLWRVDANKHQRLTRFPEQTAFALSLIAANQEQIIWTKTNGQDQQPELWRLDLKNQQTSLIARLPIAENGQRSLTNTKAVFFKGKLYFWCVLMGETTLDELWVTDFSTQGTERLVGLPNPNSEYQAAPLLFSFAERLYFFLSDGIRPSALWLTDGSVAGTKNLLTVKDGLYAGAAGDSWPARPTPYVLRTDKLIFPTFAPKDRNHSQLWSLTPTQPEQPLLLGEFDDPQLLPPAQADQSQFVYFLSGKERWQTDGTLAGTQSLGADQARKNWQATEWPTGGLTEILPLSTTAPSWLLAELDPAAGKEPWLLTAVPAKSQVLKDINTSPASADLRQVTQVGATGYFVLNSRLWISQQDPASAHEIAAIPPEETISFNAKAVASHEDTLYFLTENAAKTNSLWQATQGEVKRLKTFATASYVWLFPSTQGVYIANYSETGNWAVDLWQAKAQQFTSILKSGETKQRLATLAETAQGLLYVLEPNYTLGAAPMSHSLLLHSLTDSDLLLKASFTPIPNLLTDTLTTTAKHSYFLEQPADDPMSYQLSRLDAATKQLVRVNTPALPQQSRVLAGQHGLFILSQTPEATLWWLADEAAAATLIKKFQAKETIEALKVVEDQLYFHLLRPSEEEPVRELWLSVGGSPTLQKLKNDLEMLHD